MYPNFMKNLKIIKKKVKKIKKILKKEKLLNQYNSQFKNKQMKFLLSKIALLFNEELEISTLTKLEIELLKRERNFQFFEKFILEIKRKAKYNYTNAKWKSFSIYLFYIYQISTFFYDQKNNLKNIYTFENFTTLNDEKREYFGDFTESLMSLNIDFNLWIKQILKWVL